MVTIDSIKPEMPVISSLNRHFATVEDIVGEKVIKLKKDRSGTNHYIPLSWVTSTANGMVKVDRFDQDAMSEWLTNPPIRDTTNEPY